MFNQVQCIKTKARNNINLNNLNIDENLVVVVVKQWSLNKCTSQHNVLSLCAGHCEFGDKVA